MQVRILFADRAYGNETADAVLDDLCIRDRVIPPRGERAFSGGADPALASTPFATEREQKAASATSSVGTG